MKSVQSTTTMKIDYIRLGVYLATKKDVEWESFANEEVRHVVRCLIKEKNVIPLRAFLETLGVKWTPAEGKGAIEKIEEKAMAGWEMLRIRNGLNKMLGGFVDMTNGNEIEVDRLRSILSNGALKELGIEPNGGE